MMTDDIKEYAPVVEDPQAKSSDAENHDIIKERPINENPGPEEGDSGKGMLKDDARPPRVTNPHLNPDLPLHMKMQTTLDVLHNLTGLVWQCRSLPPHAQEAIAEAIVTSSDPRLIGLGLPSIEQSVTELLRSFASRMPDAQQLRSLSKLLEDKVQHHRLQILCRYGDYLAERLGILRQHIVENGLEDDPILAEHWTETVNTLRAEEKKALADLWTQTEATLRDEGKSHGPCYKLIARATKSLGWDLGPTIFMIDQYGTRNRLMHADLYELVDEMLEQVNDRGITRVIAMSCDDDVLEMRNFFMGADEDSRSAVEHWERIMIEFRDRWVCPTEDGKFWQARPIIQEAINAGVKDRASLHRLAGLGDMSDAKKRKKAIEGMMSQLNFTKEQNKKEDTKRELQQANERLKENIESLKQALSLNNDALGTKYEQKARECVELKQERTTMEHKTEIIEKQLHKAKTSSEGLKRQLLKENASSQDLRKRFNAVERIIKKHMAIIIADSGETFEDLIVAEQAQMEAERKVEAEARKEAKRLSKKTSKEREGEGKRKQRRKAREGGGDERSEETPQGDGKTKEK